MPVIPLPKSRISIGSSYDVVKRTVLFFIVAEKSRPLWAPSASCLVALPYIPLTRRRFQTIFSQSNPRMCIELTLNPEPSLGSLNVAAASRLSANCHDASVSLEDIYSI